MTHPTCILLGMTNHSVIENEIMVCYGFDDEDDDDDIPCAQSLTKHTFLLVFSGSLHPRANAHARCTKVPASNLGPARFDVAVGSPADPIRICQNISRHERAQVCSLPSRHGCWMIPGVLMLILR